MTGIFFPIGTSCLLSANLASRIMLVRQSNKGLAEETAENIKDINNNINSLLEKRREIEKTYREIKDYTELGVLLLIPLIAGKSFFHQ